MTSSTSIFYLLVTSLNVLAWSQNPTPKIVLKAGEFESLHFYSNASEKDNDFFKILHQEHNSILVGARNTLYNITVNSLSEVKEQRIVWAPKGAHRELCLLKGKSEDECHNYIRVGAKIDENTLLVCGTNAYRPACRHFKINDVVAPEDKDIEGLGRCPYNPTHNSTALFTDGQLYTATVADFSGGEPLIYREGVRTERSDPKQLNAPNFVSSMAYQDYVLFFFREEAVEYINCGKAVYSRVARVCKHDKGGPHSFSDRWTTFLKSRLNCSVPGEYPFYFDEIQATSDIVYGEYGGTYEDIIYGVFTTPVNSIGGSAICAFSMKQMMATFEGAFKDQEEMNYNWLPVSSHLVPQPRPGKCMNDSRTLPDTTVNFVKTHSLMNAAVPSFFSHPLTIKVSWQSRYSAIAVDPQVRSQSGTLYDVLFVGTDDGKVSKIVNIVSGGENSQAKAIVVEELQVLPPGTPVRSLNIIRTSSLVHAKLLVTGDKQLTHISLHRCKNFTTCTDCVSLQDPYCAWDTNHQKCVPYQERSREHNRDLVASQFLQNIVKGSTSICPKPEFTYPPETQHAQAENEIDNHIPQEGNEPICPPLKCPPCRGQCGEGMSQQDSTVLIYTANTLGMTVITSVFATLLIGFAAGYLCSRYFRHDTYTNMPFQAHQQLNRLDNSSNIENGSFLTSPNNKNALNLVMNVCHETSSPKNDLNEKNSTLENNKTLQKVKKTYI